MIDYITVEIGSGGSTVMVEPELRKGLTSVSIGGAAFTLTPDNGGSASRHYRENTASFR